MRASRLVPTTVLVIPLLALVARTTVGASENPVPRPPDVQTLTVNKDLPGGSVVLNWSDGTGPFSAQRSQGPDFQTPTSFTFVTRSTAGGPINDPVLTDGSTYFYLIADANAATQVFSIASAAGDGFFEGEGMIIDGVGFDAICSNNAVFFDDGTEANLLSCSSTQIQAEIPAHVVSGSVTVLSPRGVSERQTTLFAVGLRSNTSRQAQTHINVDADNNVFVADQSPGFTRIWRIDFSTGVSSECASLGNPIGLPRIGSKFYVGTETASPSNIGTVRELDASCTPLVSWGPTGTSTTDPVYARAMATDPSGNNPGYVFLLDHAGDRIRRRQNNANLDTMWLTGLGLGGTDPSASDPAGFTFSNEGEFFLTSSPSKIRHYSAGKSLVQEFTATDDLDRPAQVAFDEAQTLWIANRGADNVLRIRTNPEDRLVRAKLSGIVAPRGLAFDRDPVTTDPWMYVADATQVYRFRVYDTVHLDIKVVTEVLTSPSGGQTSQAEFERRVRDDAKFASDAFKPCGIEVIVDRILFISDPNADGTGPNGSVVTNRSSVLQQDEIDVLAQDRSTNAFAVNVYYVNHFLQQNATPPPPLLSVPLNGRAYTNDSVPTIGTNKGIMIARYSAQPVGALLQDGAITSTLAHELGHFLLDSFNNGTGDGEEVGADPFCTEASLPGSDPNEKRLMHGTGCATRKFLTTPECTDMKTNGDESAFVELF